MGRGGSRQCSNSSPDQRCSYSPAHRRNVVSQERVIHSHPRRWEVGTSPPTRRHDAANFVYVGRRTTGPNAGHFTFV
jgi:hypothetical protein